jgi:dTDP-4-dehydrorhamnose 3,5-epimerase-like enzyme
LQFSNGVTPSCKSTRDAMMAGQFKVDDARMIDLPRYAREDGEIVVAEAAASVPFAIARMFTIRAPNGARRGEHAHHHCSQLMLCVHGSVDVVCDDSRDQQTFTLDRGNLALFVPPTIWNTVIFRQDDSVLVVLCNRAFEERDYIRDYPDYLNFRNAFE